VFFCFVELALHVGKYMTYRSLVQCRGGRRERFVMCSSSPEGARSWCAQAVLLVNSYPMLRPSRPEGVYRSRDAAEELWEVEGVGRGEQSKTLLPTGRAWAPRVRMGTPQAQAVGR
jgi:hypothetical protein